MARKLHRLATGGKYFVYFRFRDGSILADLQNGAADAPELEEGCPLRDLLYVLPGWPPVCASTSVCTPLRTACPFNVSANVRANQQLGLSALYTCQPVHARPLPECCSVHLARMIMARSGPIAVLQYSEAAHGGGGGGGGGGAGRELRDGLHPRAAAGSAAEGAPPVVAPQQGGARGGALHHRICRRGSRVQGCTEPSAVPQATQSATS